MRVTIYPSIAKGTVNAPPSKSVAHRALICGALTGGSTILNCGNSADIEATLRCLKALGASVSGNGDCVKIGGLNPFQLPSSPILDCGESGSTLRFLLPLCLLSGQRVSFKGHGRLMQRPIEVYQNLCNQFGLLFEQCDDTISICGKLQADTYSIPGNISSQFITGLLFALSRLQGESRVEVLGKFESSSYVDITLSVLSAFGISIRREENTFIIPGDQEWRNLTYAVEGDYSNAAFLEAFNLLGGDVKVNNLSDETAQGDRIYKQMYADLKAGKCDFDLSDCPDLGPVMFALAAALGGAHFTGTSRLRIKESDRCTAMADELAKFGIQTVIGDNMVDILPGKLMPPSAILSGHNDHRIVMALSVLCSIVGGTIDGAEAVSKSYPDFFETVQALGIELINKKV